MESENIDNSITTTNTPSKRRLVFDRRYGWVVDEWKAPSEVALADARGMFCILPLAKSLVKAVSEKANLAAHFAVKALDKPDEFSPQALQASLNGQLQKLKNSIQEHDFNLFKPKQNPPLFVGQESTTSKNS